MAKTPLTTAGNDTGPQYNYFNTYRRGEYLEPGKALLLAILEDAIHCYRKFAGARSPAGQDLFREAEQ